MRKEIKEANSNSIIGKFRRQSCLKRRHFLDFTTKLSKIQTLSVIIKIKNNPFNLNSSSSLGHKN